MEILDWHALRSFVVVAEEGHITRAAERLNTQQPSCFGASRAGWS